MAIRCALVLLWVVVSWFAEMGFRVLQDLQHMTNRYRLGKYRNDKLAREVEELKVPSLLFLSVALSTLCASLYFSVFALFCLTHALLSHSRGIVCLGIRNWCPRVFFARG